MNMFNQYGELNASNVRETIQHLSKFASLLQDNSPVNTGLGGNYSLSDSRRDELIDSAIYTQEGKLSLAQAMANPIN